MSEPSTQRPYPESPTEHDADTTSTALREADPKVAGGAEAERQVSARGAPAGTGGGTSTRPATAPDADGRGRRRHAHLTQAGVTPDILDDGDEKQAEDRAQKQQAEKAEAEQVRQAKEALAQVPDRPQLAPEVELQGQMTESAFKDPPWLIERGGRYIQVSSLLYAVAEQIDGQRSLEDIASAVSEKIKRNVGPNDVRVILVNLIATGIVRKADGSVVDTSAAGGASGPSPLTLNMRMKMLGPRYIEPLANIFKFLYWPPVVLVVLAAAAAVEFWLYAVHGVGESIHQAVYQPSLMLNILAAIVLAAAFHEFGHAAALRYGGGNVKGMGAGLYMVYPAFYTDVTDNYRLPRWSRVRTDLGGFYFNILFALAVMGLFVLTGWEFLLLIVVLINFEIIHQLLPFVRLDGYWTLADITGIPDFFSQVGPFLRSILPSWVPLPKGRKLPEMKTWAKVFFIGYILVTIPLLLLLLFIMIRAVPRILATLIDSMVQQAAAFQQAVQAGDMASALLAGFQTLILALPTLGLVYTLYTVGKRVVVAVWNWSSKSTARRGTAAVGGVAVIALLAFLWAPQVLIPGAPPAGAPGNPLTGLIQFEPIRSGEAFTIQEAAAATAPPAQPTTAPGAIPAPGASPAPGATSAPGTTPQPSGTAPPGATLTPAPTGAAPTP